MTIGDFSRATRLSAKTLRFYHRVGLLEPSEVDARNGYRRYAVGQIATAQFIREFRALDMPVDVIREVLAAADESDRQELIRGHLQRMEAQLERTRAAVASLRDLLGPPPSSIEVTRRHVPATLAVLIGETIDLADLGDWYDGAVRELDDLMAGPGVVRAGARGGLWSTELIRDERGAAVLFVPVEPGSVLSVGGRVRSELLPAVDLAVTVHRGPDDAMGRTYAALGEYVARHGIGVDGPVREVYLQDPDENGSVVTEIGWPVAA